MPRLPAASINAINACAVLLRGPADASSTSASGTIRFHSSMWTAPLLSVAMTDFIFRALIMRRNFFARGLRVARHIGAHLLAQGGEFLLQLIDLRLLAVDRLVQFFEQVFRQAELGFQFFESRFHRIPQCR